MAHPLLYEVDTRCWLAGLSDRFQQPITLGNVPPQELENWCRLGFTHIWLMGVWTSGPKARAQALSSVELRQYLDKLFPGWQESDLVGSPYAIQDYHVPDSLGGDIGLASFRQDLNDRGLTLLLDFVPNHLGVDHPWVQSRPSLFVQGNAVSPGILPVETEQDRVWLAHGRDPYFPPWRDTVQLDYRLAAVHQAMSDLLLSVASKCDGVRCDMAMLMLKEIFEQTWAAFPPMGARAAGEFWATAIERVKQAYPEFVFLAEVYWGREEQMRSLGFDYVYDKEVLDHLVARNFPALQRHLHALSGVRLSARAHFLENHDEERAAARFDLNEHLAFATLVLALPGMRFLHQGQLTGARHKIPVQLARCPSDPLQPEIASFYDKLLTTLPKTAVGQGAYWFPLCLSGPGGHPLDSVFAIAWRNQAIQLDLVVINLSAIPTDCLIAVSDPTAAPISNWQVTDLLDNTISPLQPIVTNGSSLRLSIAPHATKLLRLTDAHASSFSSVAAQVL